MLRRLFNLCKFRIMSCHTLLFLGDVMYDF
nr:MAG TPA: protein of unknown function DUF3513 [Caudoviricetes sp.]DAZ35414.1 MAG TPA: protein of unknown function DUF3513 [Caudoviricetes sp.]